MIEETKKRPWVLSLAVLLILMLALSAWANPPEEQAVPCLADSTSRILVPVGKTVGIKLFAHGVMVVGLSEHTSAKACGLKQGDIITCMNGTAVNSIEEVESVLSCCGSELDITATRGGKELHLTATDLPCDQSGAKLGAWIRDSMAGIGTVTYYDPATGTFAALGHGINDVDTGLLMPLQSGAIMPSSVSGILRGAEGSPGALHGSFDLTHDVGTLNANTDWGIFGKAEEGYFSGEAMEVARAGELKTGPATILSNVTGEEVEEFQVEILRVYPAGGKERQSLMLRVTDPALLERTGGIVQGMSGSPILQNGKLVGAVTHVLVNDPTRGYGILAEDMMAAVD